MLRGYPPSSHRPWDMWPGPPQTHTHPDCCPVWVRHLQWTEQKGHMWALQGASARGQPQLMLPDYMGWG